MSYNVFWKKIRWDKGNSSQKRSYYTTGEYLRYITRQEAACKCKNLDAKLHNHDDLSDIRSEAIKQYESSLFNQDGFYTREQEKELYKKFKNLDNENIVYDTVITFQPEFAEKYQLFTPEKMQEIVARNLRKMLKNSQFDYDNIEWFAAFHTNTNNPHIHLGFFEKEPKHYKKGKFEYTCYANMEKDFINDQAKNIEYYVEQENGEFYAWRNTVREQLVQLTWTNVKNIHDEVNNYNNQFINKYNDLFKLFKNYRNYGGKNQGYNDLPEELKFSVIDFTKSLITNDAILSERYNEFVSEMNSRQEWLVEAAISNGGDGQYQSQFVEKTMNDLKSVVHSRMYNAVVDILKRDYIGQIDGHNFPKRSRTGGTEGRRTNQNIMGYNKQLTIRSSFYKLLNSMEKQFGKAKQSSVETFWKMDQQLQNKAKYEATKIYRENTQYNNNRSKIYKQKNQFKLKK